MTIEQFNDAKNEELKFIGTGSIDDRMRSQIVAVVGSTKSERAYWLNLFPLGAGTLNDVKSSYFRSLGYTGSLQDMEHRYWASGKGSEGFIRALFINNEPGAHFETYDPLRYIGPVGMYQDAAGTIPVTAVEQPVGLWLDRKAGMVRGNAVNTTTSVAGVAIGGPTFTTYLMGGEITAGAWYEVSFTVSNYSGTGDVGFGSSSFAAGGVTANGTYRYIKQAVTTRNPSMFTRDTNTANFSNVSVRPLPGNHATQSTSTSRPILSARYNLLLKPEQFDDAVWTKSRTTIVANAATAPDGTLTADRMVEDTTATATHRVYQIVTKAAAAATTFTYSVSLKASGRTFASVKLGDNTETDYAAVGVNLLTGALSSPTGVAVGAFSNPSVKSVDQGGGWWRVTLTATTDADTQAVAHVFMATQLSSSSEQYTGNGTDGIYAWGADLRTANDAALNQPAYQRVNTATDYDTEGFVHYLRFDGTDDSLQTPAIDFSAVDKMTVWAGVTKLSDVAAGAVVELSADPGTNNGAFGITGPGAAGQPTFNFRSRGTAASNGTPSGFTSPTSRVLSLAAGISTDQLVCSVDGIQVASPTTDQGTGNYGNYPLNIGRRNNSSLPFNGRITSLTVRGSITPASTAFVRGMEQYAARLAGQVFVSA